MLSINVPSYSNPSGYQLSELPRPSLDHPKDVLIKVHATSINPVDLKKADGGMKLVLKEAFPYKIGYDCAGTVIETGTGVSRCQVGDAVYTRLPESHRGSWSEFVLCPEESVALKPPSISFEDAASIPLAAMTALQALKKFGDISGKTVLVPAGLGGTGAYACQLAKHVFHAGKVITTVSTSKVPKVKELLGDGTVDEIIDYRKSDPKKVIQPGSVDFLFDTLGVSMEYLPLLRSKTGRIVSVSTMPSGAQLQNSSFMKLPNQPTVPVYIRIALNVADYIRRFRASRYGVEYTYLSLEASGIELDTLTKNIEEGKLKPVVGSTVDFRDIDAVRNACQAAYSGRGGIGKTVIKIAD